MFLRKSFAWKHHVCLFPPQARVHTRLPDASNLLRYASDSQVEPCSSFRIPSIAIVILLVGLSENKRKIWLILSIAIAITVVCYLTIGISAGFSSLASGFMGYGAAKRARYLPSTYRILNQILMSSLYILGIIFQLSKVNYQYH